MANLPENTKYKTLGSAVQPGLANIANIVKSLPAKRVDTSKYQSMANNISPNQGISSAPSNMKQTSNLGRVSVGYGGSTRYESFHPGVDIANKIGTPLPSFTTGVVTDVKTGFKQGDKGYGNYVIITDPQGNQHRYSHLNQEFVQIGQEVNRGAIFGTMGNTGSTYSPSGKGTGSHLDYRVKDLYNKYMNPSVFVGS